MLCQVPNFESNLLEPGSEVENKVLREQSIDAQNGAIFSLLDEILTSLHLTHPSGEGDALFFLRFDSPANE
jgi:hypothetical protein